MIAETSGNILSSSTGSSQPVSIPTLSSHRGAILKRYDGKILHGVPFDQLLEEDGCSGISNGGALANEWTDEREELLFQLQEFVNMNGANVTADATIKSYKVHCWIFSMFLIIQLLFISYYTYGLFINREKIIRGIIFVYSRVDIDKAEFTFYTILPSKLFFENFSGGFSSTRFHVVIKNSVYYIRAFVFFIWVLGNLD